MAYTQENRFLRIDTPLGDDVLLIESFRVDEAISQLFTIQADVICEETKSKQVKAEALIGKNATITVAMKNGAKRHFHGMVNRLLSGNRSKTDQGFVRFQLEIVPTLARFAARTDCRIFQNLSVLDILEILLVGANIDFREQDLKTYTKRDYCVQYRETDLNFISRLMEDEGIFYYFEHEQGKHTMVLGDKPAANQPCKVQNSAHFVAEGGQGDREDTVLQWTVTEQLRSGQAVLRDHNFQLPGKKLEFPDPTSIPRGDNSSLEIYDYPGFYSKLFKEPDKRMDKVEEEGQKTVRLRMQREETAYEEGNGVSDVRAFSSGFRFTLTDHFQPDFNVDWLLTSVQHAAIQTPGYRTDGKVAQAYSNTFTCIPHKIPFVPARVTPKPVVRGPHTAVVAGKKGEEIWPDKFGRVKVQFFWDRRDVNDETSSCWIRVAQPWAGKNWGFIAIPRVGHEVVVDFLEGDPDQPIIVGSVYNAENMPPYALPDNKTQTGIKTRSSAKGGPANFNEIRFEDKKGSELVYVHAEQNLSTVVEASETRTVGGARTTTIHKKDDTLTLDEGNRVETITKGDDTLTIKEGDRAATLDKGSDSLTVTLGGITIKAPAGTYTLEALEVIIKASTHLLIECGGSKIEMTPATITLKSPMIFLNP